MTIWFFEIEFNMVCLKKKDLPKVTVIIPCYNREKFIGETLNSALYQSYPNIEIIAVDDGSTDSTRKILENYEKTITLLEHPGRANRGQSAAINLAMRSSESDYVAILDSDDVWEPQKIEKQVAFLEKNYDIGYVYANGYAIDEKGKILYKLFFTDHIPTGDPARVLLECPIGTPSAYLVRRNIFEKAGYFDESLRSAQDHDMAIRLAEIAKIGYIDQILWRKREHAESLSGFQSERRWRLGFVILKKACSRYPYSWNIRRRRLAVLNFRLGQCMLTNGNYIEACIRFVFAGLLDPKRAIKIIIGMKF